MSIFFVMLLIVGLLTIDDYGAAYDELTEMSILRANLKDYAIRFNLPEDHFFIEGMDTQRITDNIERDHGMCAYYPLALFARQIFPDVRANSYAWSVLTWLWFMLGCLSLYGFLRCLSIPYPIALAGTLLLYLSPRFFSEGHYNNKDVVLLCLMLFTLWMGARLLGKPGFIRGLLFSFAGAMATNTKIVGVVAWGMIGLVMIVSLTANREWNKKMIMVALVTIASFILFYIALTPASLDNPIEFLRYLISNATKFSRFDAPIMFRGAEFWNIAGVTPLPWYYLPYYILVTVPLYTIVLALIGQTAVCWLWLTRFRNSLKDKKALLLMAVSLAWMIPILYAMATRPVLYNGWRHFYFTYAGIVIMAGYGLNCLWQRVKNKKTLKVVLISAVSFCLCFTSVGLVLNHPFQFAYFNPLEPRDARASMELDYWNVGDSGAFLKLYEMRKDKPGQLKVGCYFNDISIGTFKIPSYINDRLLITVNPDEDYLYYNSTYVNMYDVVEPPEGYHILFENMSYGNTIGVMYEKDAM